MIRAAFDLWHDMVDRHVPERERMSQPDHLERSVAEIQNASIRCPRDSSCQRRQRPRAKRTRIESVATLGFRLGNGSGRRRYADRCQH